MKGYLYYNAIGLYEDKLVLIEKRDTEKIIKAYPYQFQKGERYCLILKRKGNDILAKINEQEYVFEDIGMKDLFGIYLGEECENTSFSLKVS